MDWISSDASIRQNLNVNIFNQSELQDEYIYIPHFQGRPSNLQTRNKA